VDFSDRHVLIVGLGGLGGPVVSGLAEAGVGRLTLSDFDNVDRSNLPRQWLYQDRDIGRPKAEVLAAWLASRESDVAVETMGQFTANQSLDRYDLVVECSDQTDLKFALNDKAVSAGTPIVIGGAAGLRGFALAVMPQRSPCLRCVFEGPTHETRLTCRDAGVLATLPAVVGAVMTDMTLQLLAGEEPKALCEIDLSIGRSRAVEWQRRADCPACASPVRAAC
jgi:molybdopterin/thiamine biosynthesis adenylyltransferase